ncbi:ABC transporter substrate-binding protein [Ideonella livida]|uniref:ABC transporter substrate-binding protein n=1 Tax=Ideonella livida TaxID=2707176 RepID=A0A7C9TJI3_9BURK|nr:ABC transporter substrate-binding protein [Ideonella livida]NDY91778.1 ABC transporter substrate-binding protein [Ideonella livida]
MAFFQTGIGWRRAVGALTLWVGALAAGWAGLGVVPAAAAPATPAEPGLVFTSWGGSYAQAQQQTLVGPFSAQTGLRVQVQEYAGGLAQLRAQQAAGRMEWDVVDLVMGDALEACRLGLLERIDPASLEPGTQGEAPQDDYPPGTLTPCLAGTTVWSIVLVHRRQAQASHDPRTLADLFDLERFPGKRGLRRTPEGNLEWALLADGVPVEQVYAVLSTPAGVERAFRKLDTLKSRIVWWDDPATPLQLLARGEVVMSSTYNGRAYAAMLKGAGSLRFIWDGQLLSVTGLGIVKGGPHPAAARDFLRFATRPATMAAMAPLMAYGPTRLSAARLVDPVMMHLLPTAPWYRKRSLNLDTAWWLQHGEAMRRRFDTWLAR